MPYFEIQLTKKLHRLYDLERQTLIGRAPQCGIQLLSRAVSRRHAKVEFDGRHAVISDLGTKNGIKINGRKVQGAARIGEGDVVIVGDIRMRYRTADRSVVSDNLVDLRDRPAGPADVQASMAPKQTYLLRAHAEAISQFQATVARARIAKLDFEEVVRFKLQIALKEALENARVHGCGGDPNKFIHVTLSESDEEYVITVKDEGRGYRFEEALSNTDEVDALEAIRNRAKLGTGLGLRIILNCVDRLQFEGQGNTIHMGKFKEEGQLFVISEEGPVESFVEEPSEDLVSDGGDLGNPFGEAAVNPFADAPAGGAPINPFAGFEVPANPFAEAPAKDPFGEAANPFAQPGGGGLFNAPTLGDEPIPELFGGAMPSGGNPFARPPAQPGGPDPFASPTADPDPFAAPKEPANPFARGPDAPSPFARKPGAGPGGAVPPTNPFGGPAQPTKIPDSAFGVPLEDSEEDFDIPMIDFGDD